MVTALVSRAKMASRFKTLTIEEVTKLKEAAENLNPERAQLTG